MRAFKIIGFAFCSLVCCEFGHSSALKSCYSCEWEPACSTDTLHLLWLPMSRQMCRTQSKQTERFLNFKCKNCNGDFASLRSYGSHRRHGNARGALCSDESSESDIIFAGRTCQTTGILRQHSLANAKLGESFTLQIFQDMDQITQINTIIIK